MYVIYFSDIYYFNNMVLKAKYFLINRDNKHISLHTCHPPFQRSHCAEGSATAPCMSSLVTFLINFALIKFITINFLIVVNSFNLSGLSWMIRVKTLTSEQEKLKQLFLVNNEFTNSLLTRKSCGLGRAGVVVISHEKLWT